MKIHEANEILETLEACIFQCSLFLDYVSEPTRTEDNEILFYLRGDKRTISFDPYRGFKYGYFRTRNPKKLKQKILAEFVKKSYATLFREAFNHIPEWLEVFK